MIRRGKTDQEKNETILAIVRGARLARLPPPGRGRDSARLGRPRCSAIANGRRMEATRLTDRSMAKIVKAHAARLGLDPAGFSGHSPRAGFLTSATIQGASIFKMIDLSRHRSVDTLRGYVRDAELFRDHAGAGLL